MDEMAETEAFARTPRTDLEVDRRARARLTAQADPPAVDLPPELTDAIKDLQDRLTKLEARDTRGRRGKLFGKGSVAVLLLAVFLIGGTAWAYTGFGPGGASCSSWVEAKEEYYAVAKRARFHGWVSGYLTAYSLWVEHGSGPVSRADSSAGAWAWIGNYCQEHPIKKVAVAAEQLIIAIEAE